MRLDMEAPRVMTIAAKLGMRARTSQRRVVNLRRWAESLAHGSELEQGRGQK